ncbi:hypothetical protein [Sorangium sp. So ce388]|uniref:hypothetical protein n=1 Tax=Sorangium sp. So ce388 TaxID=3133309 RepID=UPI003F5C8DFB
MSLAEQLLELLWLARAMAALLVVGLVVGVPFGARLSRRIRGIEARQARLEEQQARIEAWQAKHGPPLERLAFEQRVEDPGAAVSVHRGGSRAAPL